MEICPDYAYLAIIDKSKVFFTRAKDPDRTMVKEIWQSNEKTIADFYLNQFEVQWEKPKI